MVPCGALYGALDLALNKMGLASSGKEEADDPGREQSKSSDVRLCQIRGLAQDGTAWH